jgi:tRNA pseudouridine38-40 synthase
MVFHDVDWDTIVRNIPMLLGKHDFAAFCASGSSTENTVCTVGDVALTHADGIRIFTISGDRFIYKMVRSIVGTLVDIGRGRLDTTIEAIIAGRERGGVGETAPACGLVLDYVEYKEIKDDLTPLPPTPFPLSRRERGQG